MPPGGMSRGGGGMSRGGMGSRSSGGGMSRPSSGGSRPSMGSSRLSMGSSRPSMGSSRPGGGISRPSSGGGSHHSGISNRNSIGSGPSNSSPHRPASSPASHRPGGSMPHRPASGPIHTTRHPRRGGGGSLLVGMALGASLASGSSSGSYENTQQRQLDGEKLIKRIVPELRQRHSGAKVFSFIFTIGLLGMIGLTVCGFSLISNTLGIVGIVGIVVMLIAMSIASTRVVYYNALRRLINEIEGHDKISLENLSLIEDVGTGYLIQIINKLITSNNLQGYEVIGEVGVAKTELGARAEDFVTASTTAASVQAGDAKPRITKCPNCGAGLGKGNFCEHCGTRLN